MEYLPSLYVASWTWGYTEKDLHQEELNSQKQLPQISSISCAFIHVLNMCLCVCAHAYTQWCNDCGKWVSKGKKWTMIALFIDSFNTESSSSSVWEAFVIQNRVKCLYLHLRMEIGLCQKHNEQHQFLICESAQDMPAISPKPSVLTLSWQSITLRNKQGSCYYWFPRLDRSAWGLMSSVIYRCDHEAMWLDASLSSEIIIDLPPNPVRTTLYHSKSLAFIFM